MKTMIALGLVMMSLLLVMALRGIGGDPLPMAVADPGFAEPQPTAKAAPARRSARDTTTPPAQSVHAILLAAVEAETDPDRRSEAFTRAAAAVSDAELPAMLDSLVRDPSRAADEFRQLLVRRWAETDAAAAATWTSQLPESPMRRAALEQVAIAWANTDLPAASDWVRALPESDGRAAATLALAYEAARTGPVAALELAGGLLPTRERDDLLVHAVSQWTVGDPTTAAAWAVNVPDANLRQRLVAAVAIALAEADGAVAVTLAVNGLDAGDELDRAAVAIVQRWAQKSPQAAASWVSQFPDIPARHAAVQNLLAIWTSQDAEAAGAWLRELPAGSLRDVGIATYVQALANHGRISPVAAPAGGR